MITCDKDKVFQSSVKQSSCEKNCFVCGKDFKNLDKCCIYYSGQKCLFGGLSIMELFSFVLDQKVLSDCDMLRVCGVCSTLVSEASFALHQFTVIKSKIFLLFNANKQPKLLSHLLPDNVYFDSLWPNSPVKDCPKLSLEDLAESRPRKKKMKTINQLKENLKAVPLNLVDESASAASQPKLKEVIIPSVNDRQMVELRQKTEKLESSTDEKIAIEKQSNIVMQSECGKTSVNKPGKGDEIAALDVNKMVKKAQESGKITELLKDKAVVKKSQCEEKLKLPSEEKIVVRKLPNEVKMMPLLKGEFNLKHCNRRGGRPRKPFQCQHCHLKFHCNEVLESHCKKYHKNKCSSKKLTMKVSSQETSVILNKESSFPKLHGKSNPTKLKETDECKFTITIEAENSADDEICRVITVPDFDRKCSKNQSQNVLGIWKQMSNENTQDLNVNHCACSQSLDDSSLLISEKNSGLCFDDSKSVRTAEKCNHENFNQGENCDFGSDDVRENRDSKVDLKSSKSGHITETFNKMRRIEPRPRAVKKIEDDGSIVYILSSIGCSKLTPSLIKLSPEYVKHMSEKREKLSKNSSPIVQKLGELKQKINGEKLKLLGLVNAGVSHSDKNTGVVLSHSSKSVRRKKTKVSKRPSQLKTSTSSIVVHHPNHNSSSKEHRKFRIVCEDTKYTKNGSPTSDIKAESTSNTTTDTLKSAEEISASSKDTAATSISLVRSCQICSLSFTSDILFRKHCAEHLLVQAPCSSTDSLNITSASNLPVCGAHLINEPSIVPYQETSVLLPESLSASPFPAVPISCSSLPDIKSPILDEGTPRDLSLSVLLPVLPEGLPIAPLMTTPSELRQLLAAELDDRVCDWRSKNIQNLPDNPMSMDLEIGTGRLSSAVHELSCPVINDTNLQEESMDFDRPDDSVSLDAASGVKHAMMDVSFTPPSQNSEAIRDNEPFPHSLYHEEFSSPYNFKLVPDLEPTHSYCLGEAAAAVSSPLRVDLCSEASDAAGDDCSLSTSDRMSKKLQRVSSHL